MRLKTRACVYGSFLLAISNVSYALEVPLKFSGFATVGAAVSDSENPILINREIDDVIDYKSETVFGLQADYRLSDQAAISSQLIGGAETENFETKIEWLYIDYEFSPSVEGRIGRLRVPLHMASKYIHVGNAYLWVRPPEEVYKIYHDITRYDGMDLTWRWNLGESEGYTRLFTGNIDNSDIEVDDFDFSSMDLSDIELDLTKAQLYGIELNLYNLDYELHFTWLRTTVETDFNINIAQESLLAMPPTPTIGAAVSSDIEVDTFSLGGIYHWGDFHLLSEFSIRKFDADTAGAFEGSLLGQPVDITPIIRDPAFADLAASFGGLSQVMDGGSQEDLDSRAWYVTLAYDTRFMTPYVTYAKRTDDIDEGVFTSALNAEGESYSIGFKKILSSNFSLKAEALHHKAKSDTKGMFVNLQEDPGDDDANVLTVVLTAVF